MSIEVIAEHTPQITSVENSKNLADLLNEIRKELKQFGPENKNLPLNEILSIVESGSMSIRLDGLMKTQYKIKFTKAKKLIESYKTLLEEDNIYETLEGYLEKSGQLIAIN